MENIEDVVRSYVPFMHGTSSKGWHSVYCEVCGDGARTKGPRAGWRFEGDMCSYNCFNCGIHGSFDPHREYPLSKEMYKIFEAYNIPAREYKALEVKANPEKKLVRKKKLKLPKVEQPDYFKLLTEHPEDHPLASTARTFLWEKYRMTQDDYPLFLSTGKTKSKSRDDQYWAKYLQRRIIIPAYNNGRLMYWQARTFIGEDEKKYISASVENSSSVLFGMDNIHTNFDKPLYITEGFFDSWHVKGVAIAGGNAMTNAQIEILERTKRPKVVIPDYNADGMNLARQAVNLGWGLSLPNIKPSTDICEAILEYGKLYVLKSIVDKTYINSNKAKAELYFLSKTIK